MIKQYFSTKGKRDGCIVAYSAKDIRVHFCDARTVAYDKNYPLQKFVAWNQVPFRHREGVRSFLSRCEKYFKVDYVQPTSTENLVKEINSITLRMDTLFDGIILDNPILEDKINKAQNLLLSVRDLLEM